MDESAILNQCFGTETIYSGPSSDLGKVPFLVTISILSPNRESKYESRFLAQLKKIVYEILAFLVLQ